MEPDPHHTDHHTDHGTDHGTGHGTGHGANAAPDHARGEPIPVLAAVIRRDGRHLLARRPGHKRHGGLWEFPGGKLEAGESWLEAARRELAEELDVEVVSAAAPVYRSRDPGSSFEVVFVPVEIRGEPRAVEHEALRWVELDARAEPGQGPEGLELAPADAAFVDALLGGGPP